MPPTLPPSALPLSQVSSNSQLNNLEGSRTLPRAVIFDLDGTLVDTIVDITSALNFTFAAEGFPPLPAGAVRDLVGNGATVLIEKALLLHGQTRTKAQIEELNNRYIHRYTSEPIVATTAFPFAAELLKNLRASDVAIGVCTNKPLIPSRLILERLGLAHYVGALIAPESGFGQKPNPGPLLACVSKLRVSPSEVVYVGDHAVDVETARAAGIRVVTVTFGYSSDTEHHAQADRTIASLADLPEALLSLA